MTIETYNARMSERILRHVCQQVKKAGASRNHRDESRVERGPFGLGILHMDIDASWAGDQRNREIYIPDGTHCPYCGDNLKAILKEKNND